VLGGGGQVEDCYALIEAVRARVLAAFPNRNDITVMGYGHLGDGTFRFSTFPFISDWLLNGGGGCRGRVRTMSWKRSAPQQHHALTTIYMFMRNAHLSEASVFRGFS
jgi:hypothetical protein